MPTPIIPISATPGVGLVPKAGAGGKLAAGWIPFSAPGPIGSGTPDTGAFTALTATSLDVAGNIRTRTGTPPSFAGAGSIIASVPDASGSAGAILHAQVGDNTGAFGGFSAGYGTAINWLIGISKGASDTTALAFYENAIAAQVRLAIGTGGAVGVGGFPPSGTRLYVTSGANYAAIRAVATSTTGVGIQLQPSATGGQNWLILSTANGASTGGGLLSFWNESGGGSRMVVTGSGRVGVGNNAPATALDALTTDATTNAVVNLLTLGKAVSSTGVGANGLGVGIVLSAESATDGSIREQIRIRSLYTTATDASRKSRGVLSAYDTAERDALMWEASGSAPMLGFFGTAPVTKPTALTAQLTTITHTAPGTPDYALQNLTNSGGYGFATLDEGNTFLSVVANLQTRVAQLETKLQSLGLVA